MLSRTLCRRFIIALTIGVLISSSYMVYRRLFSGSSLSSSSSSSAALSSIVHMSSGAPVIVVGSGLAGLSAAYEALAAGARVHMLDRAPKPGGNSMKASSGINGAGTRFQRQRGIDKDESFLADSVRSAGLRYREWEAQGKAGAADRSTLIRMLAEKSEGAVTWLVDEIGVDLSVVAPLGGHSVPRTHRGAGKTPPGAAIVTTLLAKLGENPNFQLSNNAEVTALDVVDTTGVRGVKYTLDGQEHTLRGPVVFAAGGFAGDATGLLAKHRPDLAGLPSTNDARPGAHTILQAAGAALVDMDRVQVHPTGFVDPKDPTAAYKFLAAEALRGEGGILLSSEGKRFVNELDQRDVVSKAVMELGAPTEGATRLWDVTLLLDPGACEAVAGHLGFYMFKGFMAKKRVSELEPSLVAAVDSYAAQVAAGQDADFGRTLFGHWRLPTGKANRDQEVCVGKVTPIVHFTMGGVAFNSRAEVLAADGGSGTPIGGLWAAGEITGGIHGDNRLGGSSLLECVVFGRIAGVEAAKKVEVAA